MEAGNRDDEDRLGAVALAADPYEQPQSPHRHYEQEERPQRIHLQPQTQQQQQQKLADPFGNPPITLEHNPGSLPQSQSQSQHLSATLAAFAANNQLTIGANADLTSIHVDPAAVNGGIVNPDDFYKAISVSSSGSSTTAGYGELMASSTVPAQRHHPDPRSSNPNGTSARQPAAPSPGVARSGLRPALRSVSAPVDEAGSNSKPRSAAASYSNRQPSVKDLKKRFDQNAAAQSSNSHINTAGRKTTPRTPAKEAVGTTTSNYRGVGGPPGKGQMPSPHSATRRTPRSRVVAEDQMSNNCQSFASRISNPRTAGSASALSSKSMSNLSPTASSLPIATPTNPPISPLSKDVGVEEGGTSHSRGLLFGEILPSQTDSRTAGYGIDKVRHRRTSESNLSSSASQSHQRSLSHPEGEPPSPTDWYRNVNGVTAANDKTDPNGQSAQLLKSHGRAYSDTVGIKHFTVRPKVSTPARTSDETPPPTHSKLPVSVRKQSNPSSPASPDTSRSNSPSTYRRLGHRNQGKIPRATGSTTPSDRVRSPTFHQNSKRPTALGTGTVTPHSSTRLNAFISSPPPKLSPPLRSSRPRQPVSTATTASSRMKANDKGRSSPQDTKSRPNQSDQGRRRKIMMGPIDFESRREQIRLSYSKSIRENEARAAARRKEAEERERKKKEAEVKAAAEAARAARAKLAAAQKQREEESRIAASIQQGDKAEQPTVSEAQLQGKPPSPQLGKPQNMPGPGSIERTLHAHPTNVAETERTRSEQPSLTITTAQSEPQKAKIVAEAATDKLDSPTLGIPGSFPNLSSPEFQDEAPPSAVSNTTEFDAEPQMEPPTQLSPQAKLGYSLEQTIQDEGSSSRSARHVSSEYKSPFEDFAIQEENAISNLPQEASSASETTQAKQPTPARSDFSVDLNLPGAFTDEVFPPETLHELQESALRPVSEEAEDAPQSPHDGQGHSIEPLLDDDEYVPGLPVKSSDEAKTTVRILGINTDFPLVSSRVEVKASSKAEDEIRADQNENHQHLSPTSSDDVERAEDSQTKEELVHVDTELGNVAGRPANVGDSAARLRDSSDVSPDHRDERTWSMDEQRFERPRFSTDSRRTIETRPSLNVPRSSASVHRTSQNSAWTDYTVESRDDVSDYRVNMASRDSGYRQNASISELPSRSQSFRYERTSKVYTSSSEVSPHGSYRSPILQEDQLQLPELDTGGGFVVDYIPRQNKGPSSIPALPEHSPPPPPGEATLTDASISAPASEYRNDTRPNSYLYGLADDRSSFSISRPQSENFDITNSTSQSPEVSEGPFSTRERLDSQQTLAESFDQSDGSADMPPKERKRLFTRLETLKELIDTEAFFIRDMNIVEEIYKGTAEACPQLDDQTIKLIFRNTDQIIAFHSHFLNDLKEGVASVYIPKTHRSNAPKESSVISDGTASVSTVSTAAKKQLSDVKDRETSLGPIFIRNMEQMKVVHETFLKNSDHASKRLIQIQEDPTVKVWLNECNEVARDLTKAWNLDSLLIKPMQRITKYPNLLIQILHETPQDHPDRPALESAKASLEDAIVEINKTKKNFELVGQIVGRKRKEGDVRTGLARAFGKRVDKLQAASNRPPEDPDYLKLHEKFGDDYLRLQVVLRDVEYYTRQTTAYVHEFLQYLSSMELVMRLQPSPHPEIESKWVRFNVSMRDIEKVALEQHLSQVRKHVIEPFEQVIKAYGNPSLAMKKRAKRRLDYEKSAQLKKNGKKIDKQLAELVEQYDALNDALKKELPKLSEMTERVGNICLANFVNIQAQWYSIWSEKVRVVLDDPEVQDPADIVSQFQRDWKFQEDQAKTLSIIDPMSRGRTSQSTSADGSLYKIQSKPAGFPPRGRGLSINSEGAPTIPPPDFAIKRYSGNFTISPIGMSASNPQMFYKDYYAGISGPGRITSDASSSSRTLVNGAIRPSTAQSHDSVSIPRQSIDSNASQSNLHAAPALSQPVQKSPDNHRFSGLFHSALPLPDEPERPTSSRSRPSSRERRQSVNGYKVLWLAASLFEFNIETTKHEAGYPYLTYQAGEIFDVIAEKGELWLAKNQDDPNNLVGWLWSKHFAKLADD